jgi:flagellar biosynthesis protein FlhB
MIRQGETSVERTLHQNYQQTFIFPQMHGISLVENWKRFFGIRNLREFVQRILLPSTHKPKGNGVIMNHFEINANLINYALIKFQSSRHPQTRKIVFISMPRKSIEMVYKRACKKFYFL